MNRFVTILTLLAFLFIGCFGFIHIFYMTMTDAHAEMTPCPFMDIGTTDCAMTITEHLSAWQAVFAVVLLDQVPLLSIFIISILFSFSLFLFKLPNEKQNWRIAHSLFQLSGNIENLYDQLFSAGILNSKAF